MATLEERINNLAGDITNSSQSSVSNEMKFGNLIDHIFLTIHYKLIIYV